MIFPEKLLKGRKVMDQRKFRLRIWEILAFIFVIVLLASGVDAIQTQASLSAKVVRLHVLANSDAENDQALKLEVRDAILSYAEPLLDSVADQNEAEAVLRGQLLELEETASEVIRSAGYSYPVTVELSKTEFPTREYHSFSLPAGEYLALRVLIGEAEGQNWWCVVFPPLCSAVAADFGDTCFSEQEIAFITEDTTEYQIKFKIIELLTKCF
jgi:stage II sporulation protein R